MIETSEMQHLSSMPEPLPDFEAVFLDETAQLSGDSASLRATAPEMVGNYDEIEETSGQARAAAYVGPLASEAAAEAELPEQVDDLPPTDPPEAPPETGDDAEPDPPYETRRTSTHTLLVSTVHPNPELAEQAAEILAHGVPGSWEQIGNEGSVATYYTDSAQDPTLFLKHRGDALVQERLLSKARRDGTEDFAQGYVEVIPEMEVAPLVQEAINTPEAQQIARDNGYESLSVVMPLVAGTNTLTAEKWTVYPWSNGYSLSTGPDPNADDTPFSPEEAAEAMRLDGLSEQLAVHLISKGINPHGISSGNFMVRVDDAGKQHAELIDIAHYKPMEFPAEVQTTDDIPPASSEILEDFITDPAMPYEGAPAEALEQPFTTRHTESAVLYVSNTHPNPERVEAAAALLSEGISAEQWTSTPTFAAHSPEHYQDDPENPTLFLKVHANAQKPLNEITNAPIVQEAIDSLTAQIAARSLPDTFTGVTYVTPLLAGVDTATGRPFTVYEWVEGHAPQAGVKESRGISVTETEQFESTMLNALAGELGELLDARGIAPNDFHGGNIMIVIDEQGNRSLRVIDASDFYRHSE